MKFSELDFSDLEQAGDIDGDEHVLVIENSRVKVKQARTVAQSVFVKDSAGNVTGLEGAGGEDIALVRQADLDSNGRLANYTLNGKNVAITYDENGLVTAAGTPPPWLYQDNNGPAQWLHQTNVRGVGFAVNSKVYAISTQDRKCHVYQNGVWSIASAAIHTGGIHHLFFMAASGTLFTSWATSAGTGGQNLYRSADGGVTWTKVLDSTVMLVANDYLGSMAEADNGYLFATSYNGTDSAPTPTIAILRSTDDGVTWTDITANLVFQPVRHIHSVFWDKHRNALWLDVGDSVPDDIQVSTDYGSTWQRWNNSFQATAMTADADYFYFCSDVSGDHSIYRAAGSTVAEILASTPVKVLQIGSSFTPVSPYAGMDGTEFAWWGRVDDQGNVIFSYGKGARACIAVSSDQGGSWGDALVAASGVTQWAFEPVFPSEYVTGWDGMIYHQANGTRYARRWRVYSVGSRLGVNSSSGDDDFGDGINTPFATIPESGVTSKSIVELQTAYTKNASLGLSGLVLNRKGHALGVAESGTLTVEETFEGTSSLTTTTANGGTVDQASVANPYAGTKSALCTLNGTAGGSAMVLKTNAFSTAAIGDELWMSGRFYVTAASITASLGVLHIQAGVFVYVDTTAVGGGLMAQTSADSKFFRQNDDAYTAFPLGEYVHLKMRVKKHATAGTITVWQNGKRILHVVGVNTNNTGAVTPRWGAYGNQALSVMVDNAKASVNFDPEMPSALVLNGTGQLVLPDLIRS